MHRCLVTRLVQHTESRGKGCCYQLSFKLATVPHILWSNSFVMICNLHTNIQCISASVTWCLQLHKDFQPDIPKYTYYFLLFNLQHKHWHWPSVNQNHLTLLMSHFFAILKYKNVHFFQHHLLTVLCLQIIKL